MVNNKFWKDLHTRLYGEFPLTRDFREPCPEGPGCEASHTNDEYVYYPGCYICNGKGTRVRTQLYTAGFLMANVANALWLDRAFWEGYSAGVTDGS